MVLAVESLDRARRGGPRRRRRRLATATRVAGPAPCRVDRPRHRVRVPPEPRWRCPGSTPSASTSARGSSPVCGSVWPPPRRLAFALDAPRRDGEQPRGPGPRRGRVGRRAGHARRPGRRRPARRGVRGPPPRATRRRLSWESSPDAAHGPPEGSPRSSAASASPSCWPATGRAATAAMLGAVPGATLVGEVARLPPARGARRPGRRAGARRATPWTGTAVRPALPARRRHPDQLGDRRAAPPAGRPECPPPATTRLPRVGPRRAPRRGRRPRGARRGRARAGGRGGSGHAAAPSPPAHRGPIEEANYPRPWSATIFLVRARPAVGRAATRWRTIGPLVVGFCGLMVVEEDGHITTLTVDPAWHRRGIGTVLLLDQARAAPALGRAPPDARGAGVEHPGPGAVPPFRLRAGGRPAELLRRDRRGRHRHVGARHRHRRLRGAASPPSTPRLGRTRDRRGAAQSLVLGIETSCDDTAAAVVDAAATRCVLGGVQPGRPARRLRRGRPRARRPGPSRAAHPRDRRRPRPGRRWGAPTCDAVAATVGPRADRLAPRGGERGQGAGPGLGPALRGGQPPRGPSLRRPARPSRHRVARGRAARVGGPHPARVDGGARAATGSWARPSTTPPGRPSTRWPGSSASATPAARPSSRRRRRVTPRPSPFPGPCSTTASTSPSAGSRRRWSAPCGATPDASRRGRGGVVPAGRGGRARGQGRARRGGDGRRGRVPGRGGGRQRPPAGRAGRGVRRARPPRLPAQPGHVHRQRGDDRAGGLVAARAPRARPRSTPAPIPNLRLPLLA